MISKEEIEKAKDRFEDICVKTLDVHYDHVLTTLEIHYLKLLLQYIDQLENENSKLNKVIDEMAKYMSENMECNFITSTNEKCVNTDCKDCFKQYLEKKVEGK